MIAGGQIYVDLENDLLAEPNYARIFRSKQIASAMTILDIGQRSKSNIDVRPILMAPGESFLWNGVEWTIMNLGTAKISLLRKDGKAAQDIDKDLFETYVKEGIFKGLSPVKSDTENEAIELLKKASKADLMEALRRYQIILPRIRTGRGGDNRTNKRTERNYWTSYKKAEKKYGHGFVGLLPKRPTGRPVNDTPRKKNLSW